MSCLSGEAEAMVNVQADISTASPKCSSDTAGITKCTEPSLSGAGAGAGAAEEEEGEGEEGRFMSMSALKCCLFTMRRICLLLMFTAQHKYLRSLPTHNRHTYTHRGDLTMLTQDKEEGKGRGRTIQARV